jgi:outer membrane protein
MRREWIILFAFIFGVLATAGWDRPATAQKQELLKVGFVDLVRVRDEYTAYQTALTQIKETKEKEQGELDNMVAMFDKNVKNYELKEGLITEEEQKVELDGLKQKYETLSETHQNMSQQLEAQSRKILKPLLDQMKTAIEQVSAAQSYHLIFWKKDLAYSDARLDITDEVLKVLNQ